MLSVALAFLLVYFLCSHRPGGRGEMYELFAGAGFKRTPPLKGMSDSVVSEGMTEQRITNATPDLVQFLIQSVLKHFSGQCMFPIETNGISKVTGGPAEDLYKCSFTFSRMDTGFPTGVVVQALVEGKTGKVFAAATHSKGKEADVESFIPEKAFRMDTIKTSLPTAAALKELRN